MQTVMDIMEGKNMEKKVESTLAQHVEFPADKSNTCCLTEERDDICQTKADREPSNGGVASTVHVQQSHSFQSNVQATPVLPRASSEQSKLRILTRTPAVQSLSSPPSEESSEDLPQDNGNELQGLRDQASNKDESESGFPSLSSSRENSFDYTDSTGTDLNEFIVKTLKNQRDKKMLLKLEKDFLGFISDPRKVFLQYPPMTSYHRMIVHRVAAYFGLDHNVDQSGKCIIVNKCANTRYPEARFSELVREDSEEDPLPKLILKRQNSSIDESTPSEGNSPHSRTSLEDKKSKSIEEREEEYVKARARIFNHGSLSSQSSASSKDGDSCLSGLRDTSIDDETGKITKHSDQNMESAADKTACAPLPAVKVLTNSSRPPNVANSKLMQDVSSKIDASSSASCAAVTTTVTDSKFDSNLPSGSPDTTTVLAEGAPLLAGNLPSSDVTSRSKIVGTAGMIPLLSPNQTGGVVWTLPENQGTYPSGHGSMFVGQGTGSQVVGPEGYQAPTVALQQGIGTMPAYFFSGQTGQTSHGYQPQPQRQPTPPQQQTQSGFPGSGIPMTSHYGSQSALPMYQTTRMFPQQELETLPQQPAGTVSQGSPHSMVVPRAGSPSSSYREISSQFAGMSLGHLEQENQVFPKQRPPGTTYTPNCTQSFSPGQPYQYMVYRHSLAAMLAQPISTQGQPTSGYLYSSPNPQAYGQPPYDQQVYNQQLYTQQPFNQSYTVGDQPLLAHQSGSHTPPTPPPSVSPMGTNPAFMSHVPTVPGATPRQQISTQVINPALSQVPARLVSPYSMPGQQLIHMPGAQQTYAYSQPYSHGQTRTTVQQSPRYKSYSEKGLPKPVDIYNPDPVNQRRPSPTCSPRGNISGSSQSRRTSGGVAGKGHGKKEGERGQHQQMKGKQKHRKSQHRHAGDSSRKQPQPGPSSLEPDQTSGAGTCVLEVYDVTSSSTDLYQVVGDLLQAGAQITWNEKNSPTVGNSTVTAKATFNSSIQAEQALRTNSNPNYKLRRWPAEIPVMETGDY